MTTITPPPPPETAAAMETWETTIPGTIYLKRWDERRREYRDVRVGGPGGTRRITLTAEDRDYNQSQVREDLRDHDPFENGSLVRVVDGKRVTEGVDDKVARIMQVVDPDEFLAALKGLPEREVRMLRDMIEETGEGRVWQHSIVRDHVEENFVRTKRQRTVVEMERGGSGGGEQLYGDRRSD